MHGAGFLSLAEQLKFEAPSGDTDRVRGGVSSQISKFIHVPFLLFPFTLLFFIIIELLHDAP